MNQILHKAKLKNQDRWVVGFYCNRQETTYCFKEDYERHPVKTFHYIVCDEMTDWGLPNEFRFYEIDPEALCVFTGLTDKNGNKIWENDIVRFVRNFSKYRWSEGCNFEVYYNEFLCHFALADDYGKNGQYDRFNLTGAKAKDIEVVGNIFDNPELLKEKN